MATKKESPMMKQFKELKAKHPEAILLFRCGDFYETYEEDAKACAKVLGITLTEHKDGYQMAGFPHHALDGYLPKLIRAGKRVAICDQLEDPKLIKRLVKSASKREQSGACSDYAEHEQTRPEGKRGITELASNATKESETNNSNNSKSETTMAKKLQAADLIGKAIVKGNMSYNVKGAEGDTLTVESVTGDRTTAMPPMSMEQVEKLLAGGWTVSDTQAQPATVEEVEEVSAITPTKPVAQTVDMKPTTKPKAKNEKPKAKSEGRGKTSDVSHQPSALKYETYQNKKGKTCARIVGFREDDAAYQQAAELHGSATYETKKGEKVYLLIFGPRYAEAAKEVCQVLNEGKTLADCKAIIDKATADRQQQREEWKARRAERNAQAAQPAAETTTGYTDKDVADMLKRIMAGEAIPENIKAAMAA